MSSVTPLRVLIVGAGAVGCFYGSRLHRPSSSQDSSADPSNPSAKTPPVLVSLICRSNYKTIKSRSGVQMRTCSFGNYFFSPEQIFPSISEASSAATKWDYIVVATKSLPDTSDDSVQLNPLMKSSPDAVIVLIQNGIGVEEPYRNTFRSTTILSAVTVVSAEQVGDGVVVQNRWTRISVGPFTDGLGIASADSIQTEGYRKTIEFVNILKAGGIKDAEGYNERELQRVRWHKVAINAAMNPSSVLSHGTTNAEMVKSPILRSHLKAVILEVLQAATKVLDEPESLTLDSYLQSPSVHLATPDQILTSTERNAGGKPSMLVDWERGGKVMELEVILGNPIRAAKKVGLEMPRLETMYALLGGAQSQRRKVEEEAKSKL